MADAFGTQVGIYLVDLVTLVDGAIRAFGLTYIAVDALIGNHQGHSRYSKYFKFNRSSGAALAGQQALHLGMHEF